MPGCALYRRVSRTAKRYPSGPCQLWQQDGAIAVLRLKRTNSPQFFHSIGRSLEIAICGISSTQGSDLSCRSRQEDDGTLGATGTNGWRKLR